MSKTALSTEREQRIITAARLEMRAEGEDAGKITGYAAVFDQPSLVMNDWFGQFREIVAKGCFTKTLKDGADVRGLVNHDTNFVLGRTKSGTCKLWEDDYGLAFEITPPDTQWARDLAVSMKRGDINQCSFSFRVIRERWGTGTDDEGNAIDERTLLEVQLFDVSVVTYPAYPATEANMRSIWSAAGLDYEAIGRVAMRAKRELSLTGSDCATINAAIDTLRSFLPSEPSPSTHSEESQEAEPTRSSHSIAELRRRLDLVAVEI
jgi:HK97 family phage prohead protease